MKEVIAKRYTAAMVEGMSTNDLVAAQEIFATLATSIQAQKDLFFSPYVDNSVRLELLLSAVASAKSDRINNTIKLLVEKIRIDVLDAIAENLAVRVSQDNKTYSGVVYANSKIKKETLTKLGTSIGKKLDAKIAFEAVADEYNGVKVAVDDLGVEVSFSKSNVRNQMIQHILKSI